MGGLNVFFFSQLGVNFDGLAITKKLFWAKAIILPSYRRRFKVVGDGEGDNSCQIDVNWYIL